MFIARHHCEDEADLMMSLSVSFIFLFVTTATEVSGSSCPRSSASWLQVFYLFTWWLGGPLKPTASVKALNSQTELLL